jgi:hypothetical protein
MVASDTLHHAALHRAADGKDVTRLVDRRLADEGTTVGDDRHQTLALERRQCLADAGRG